MPGGFYGFWHVGQTFWGFLWTRVHMLLRHGRSAGGSPLQSFVPFTPYFYKSSKKAQPNTLLSKYFLSS